MVEQLAADLADVLAALDVTGPLTLAGHSMGGMVALAYLGLPPADRPVEPHGLVLAATAAGRLAERGVARLLASPATDVLCGLAARTPQRAVRLLTKPVCATLALQVGNHARPTLTTLFATALATTSLTTAVGFLPGLRSYDQYSTLASDPRPDDHHQRRSRLPHPTVPRPRPGRRHPRRHTPAPAHGRAHAPSRGPPRRHGRHQPHDRHAHQRPPAT